MMGKLTDLEKVLMADPEIRAEVEKLRPVLAKISDMRLVALSIVLREETERRQPPRRVEIGNR